MSSRRPISRRTILRGLGVSLALPMLDAMTGGRTLAMAGEVLAGTGPAASAAASASPLRMAMFFLPNGMCMQDWTPGTEGAGFELSPTLKPMEPVRDQLTVLSGLALDNA